MPINFLFSLSFSEIFFLVSLFIICLWDFFKTLKDKNWINFFKPTTFFTILTIFYCLVGPIFSVASDDGSLMYRAVNHREFYEIGLIAAFLTYLSFRLGFDYKKYFKIKKFGINKLKEYRLQTRDLLLMQKWGERIIIITFFFQFIKYGPSLISRIISTNESADYSAIYGGFFFTFISQSVNFAIFGLILLFISLLNGIKERTKFIFYFSITLGLFINLGFRYRLLLIFIPLILVYLFYKKIKPSLIMLLSLFLSAMLIFGFFQGAREYGKGLSFERWKNRIAVTVTDKNTLEYVFQSAFFDTNVFHTSAAIIHKTPEVYNYVGIKPIINAITLPIPRQLWPSKPSGRYIKDIYKIIYAGKYWEVGAANLGFAEYYLAGGWIALIVINFFIGLFFKKIWCEFLINFNDPVAQIRYALYISYMYIIFTRGYLLQLIYIYFSLFIPFYLFSYIWNKRFR